MVAIVILTIGLFSTAALMSTSVNTTAKSHYMSTAAMLARKNWKISIATIKTTPPSSMRAAASRPTTLVTLTASRSPQTTASSPKPPPRAAASTSYTQTPAAGIVVTPGAGLPPPTPDSLIFDRRWTVTQMYQSSEFAPSLSWFTLQDSVNPVKFQMSVVRP